MKALYGNVLKPSEFCKLAPIVVVMLPEAFASEAKRNI